MGTHPIFESDFDCLTERMADSSADELSEKIRHVCQKIDMTADPEISSPHEISTQDTSPEPETLNIIANLPEESDVFQLLDQQTRSESAGSFISEGSESRARSKSAQIVEDVIAMGAKIIQSENQTDSLNVKEISSSRSNATESSRIEEIVSNPTSQIDESCEVKSVETSSEQKSRDNDTVNETADSLTRRVRDVLTMPPPGSGKFHSNSAMDSIE